MYINEHIWSMYIVFHKENILSGDTAWAHSLSAFEECASNVPSLSALEECASKPADAHQLPSRKKKPM